MSLADDASEEIQPAVDFPASGMLDGKPLDGKKHPIANAEAETQDFFSKFLHKGDWLMWFNYGALGLVLLGFGLFLRRKLATMQTEQGEFEQLVERQQQGQRVSFQEMASAYKKEKPAAEPKRAKAPERASTSDMIGLSALKQRPMSAQETPAPAMPPQQPQSRSAARPPQAPKKQAINQYQKQQVASKAPTGNPQAQLEQELRRAREVQQRLQGQPQQRQMPAGRPAMPPQQPQRPGIKPNASTPKQAGMPPRKPIADGNPKAPIPENPQVLDFLRNVADLMEKDGKTHIAQTIQKNIR